MVFTRFVEIGRVALINYGPLEGKLCTIIDVVDEKRVLVDGPFELTGVHRHVIGTKRLSLTDLRIRVGRNASQPKLVAAWKKADVLAKWEATAWAKKRAMRAKRANLTDFDRFKVMIAKKQRSKAIQEKLSA